MLIDLSQLIKRGVIDNTKRGVTTLSLWGEDEARPAHFILDGDCSNDIAACLTSFQLITKKPKNNEAWNFIEEMADDCYEWKTGDITLSKRCKESNNRGYITNALSIEFFAGESARLLLESECYQYQISAPHWHQTWGAASAQAQLNLDALRNHISYNVAKAVANMTAPRKGDRPFPRSIWDETLQRAEVSVNIAQSLRGKYSDSYSELACIAYVFQLEDTLQQLAECDENTSDTSKALLARELGPFDYLETRHKEAVKEAMTHPLFERVSKITEKIFAILSKMVEKRRLSPEQDHHARLYYASTVSKILASIIIVQTEDNYSNTMMQMRLEYIQYSLKKFFNKLPKEQQNKGNIDQAIFTLIQSLDDFSQEFSD